MVCPVVRFLLISQPAVLDASGRFNPSRFEAMRRSEAASEEQKSQEQELKLLAEAHLAEQDTASCALAIFRDAKGRVRFLLYLFVEFEPLVLVEGMGCPRSQLTEVCLGSEKQVMLVARSSVSPTRKGSPMSFCFHARGSCKP